MLPPIYHRINRACHQKQIWWSCIHVEIYAFRAFVELIFFHPPEQLRWVWTQTGNEELLCLGNFPYCCAFVTPGEGWVRTCLLCLRSVCLFVDFASNVTGPDGAHWLFCGSTRKQRFFLISIKTILFWLPPSASSLKVANHNVRHKRC